jgi:HAD superfamily hydrolase (TIGR01549 family)
MSFSVSFDFWNTLFANGAEEKRQELRIKFFRTFIPAGNDPGSDAVKAAFVAATEYFLHHWRTNLRTPTASERIIFIAKQLSINLNKQNVREIADYFGSLIFEIPPHPIADVHSTIAHLASKYSLGIISDTGYISGKYIRQFLKNEGMFAYFQSFVFSDEQMHSKPHPAVFQITCNNLGNRCSKLIHIGDLEETDIQGAKNAGCISIKYTGTYPNIAGETRADYQIRNYDGLPQLIDSIA